MKYNEMACVAAMGLWVACAADDGPSYGEPLDNPQAETAGTQSVQGATDLTMLSSEPGDESAAGKAFAVYGTFSQMASVKQSNSVPTMLRDSNTSNRAWDESCVTTSGGTSTYNQCESGTTTINGTITGTATSLEIDLMLTAEQADVEMSGKLNFSPTSLEGNLKYTTSVAAGGRTINTVYEGTYSIVFDAQGCATGGQVEVHHSISAANINIYAKAEFGPACGDVTFY